MSRIPKHLKEKIDSMPQKPGIYKMKDNDGNIIYVGKSKTLKSRVKSYFYTEHEWSKLKMLIFNIQDIEYIETDTHLEALIMECELIKKLKPMYNNQLKNHKKYKYLKINKFNRYGPISITHEREEDCFGPYRSKGMLEEVTKFFQNIYPITQSEGSYGFTYKIFPESMKKDSFENNKKNLTEIFSNKNCMQKFLSVIEEKMMNAASNNQFETASIYRDMQMHMKYLYNTGASEDNDLNIKKILVGEKIEEGYKLFYISNTRIIFKKKYKKINREAVEIFLLNAKEHEENVTSRVNEKRDLDFKTIIITEIEDQASKAVVYLKGNGDIDFFIEKLLTL
ncbi:MAG: GIY-YIG nuclease family protein [Clostridia bacterium]|nr:GIY-YIG nuclease family protein [Clostridia bacterium]